MSVSGYLLYKNAVVATEEALKIQALGISITLNSFIQNLSLERLQKEGSRIMSEMLIDEKWEGIAFIALYDKDGTIVLHSNPALINKVFEDIKEVKHKRSPLHHRITLLILYGETGTGKSAVARAIHKMSKRNGEFVEINCASIPESLIESELFGYEKGAFSGALKQKLGKIELAKDGTLFLDEIGELTTQVQSKFLKVLQNKTFERLRGLESIKTNARFITAINKDLKQMVKDGKFREDLYFRLNVFPIKLPPLRDRRSAVLKLAEYLIDKISLRLGKERKKLSEQSLQILNTYSFPGNIRELENILERGIILSNSEKIILKPDINEDTELNDLKSLEKKAILEAIKNAKGNKKKSCKLPWNIFKNSLLQT